MAMLAHREYFREQHGIDEPEIVACTTAHAALDKACHYFGIKLVHTDPDPKTLKADPKAFERSITNNTILLYTSAPTFPHGVIDPVVCIAAIAKRYGIGCHVDNCLGGFLLSHLKTQDYIRDDQNFDLSVDGVTSLSVDIHKYGLSSKGTSVVLYQSPELRRGQYTTVTDWLGGLYCTTGAGGSRGGGPIAAAWASMLYCGAKTYSENAKIIHATFLKLKAGISKIPGLRLMGDPDAAIIAYTSDEFDIYKVADEMSASGGWEVPRMQRPPCIHICVCIKTPDIMSRYLSDLEAAALKCRDTPAQVEDGLAGIYGQASIVPDRSVVGDILKGYLDVLYSPHSAEEDHGP
jgi:sphinganine-1-phosphate aldolase